MPSPHTCNPMRILFVHQNFPGQYKHLAPAMAARGHDVRALAINDQPPPPGVAVQRYWVTRGTTKDIHPWAAEIETKVLRGEACARAAMTLKEAGFTPDVICAHPGWGESLFLRDVWPEARQLHFVEFYYSAVGRDIGFDPEFGNTDFADRCRVRMKNANNLLNLAEMDHGISPTAWQKSTVPAEYQRKISVIHDGIDTTQVCPDASASFDWRTADGELQTCRAGDEIVSFVNRNLEPNRGYHIFMRSLPELLVRNPKLRVLIIGGDGVSYGSKPAEGSYKQRYLDEVSGRIDQSRVHFLGRLPYAQYLKVLQVSAAHVYLTYPFVLSWSMLEAMSAGCMLIASRTPPVVDVITHGKNGMLVDFFSIDEIVTAITSALRGGKDVQSLRKSARKTVVTHYDLQTRCLPAQIALIESMG